MTYIENTDFSINISEMELDALIKNNATTLDSAELKALSQVESYLSNRFNMATEWAKNGTARHQYLVMLVVDIMIYHLASSLKGNTVRELRINRYNEALDWLKQVADFQLSPNLTPKVDEDDVQITPIKWGSNTKLKNDY